MSRHDRRRAAATGQPSPEELRDLLAGCRWERKVDPDDPRFFLIEIRLPESDPDRAEETETGAEVEPRIVRFCNGFLSGYTGPGYKQAPSS